MINDKAILVGVDGSHASYKATWWAANYAKHAGLTLQIVCAYSLPSYAAVSFDATYTAMGDDNAAHSDAQENSVQGQGHRRRAGRRSRHADCYRRSGIGVRRTVAQL